MWVCNSHMKEALTLLEAPHISKTPYQIKCSLCDDRAVAKIYYAHEPLSYKRKQALYYLIKNEQKQSV